MPSQPNLFESVPTFDRQSLAARIRTLAEREIFIGTSSWRYEGWLGQVYTPERYFTRGKFSKNKFHEESILEYAESSPSSAATSRSTRFPRRPSGKSS